MDDDKSARNEETQGNDLVPEFSELNAWNSPEAKQDFFVPRSIAEGKTPSSSHHHHHHRHHHHHHHRRRKVIIAVVSVILAILCALVITGCIFYKSAQNVAAQASQVTDQASTLESQLLEGDGSGAVETATSMSQTAKSMHEETSTPLWNLASHMPVYGNDIQATQTLCAAFDDLATNALVPVTNDIKGTPLADILGEDNTINVEALQNLLESVGSVSPVIDRTSNQINSIEVTRIDRLQKPLDKVKSLLNRMDSLSSVASELSGMVPSMLGADGNTKYYLVVAQNNAEIHATGGLAGSMGVLAITNGKMELGEFYSPWEVNNYIDGEYEAPALTDEEVLLFGQRLILSAVDVNYTFDFSRASEILNAYWQGNNLGPVDGVIAVDPIFLQDMLALSGGITTSNGTTIDESNAARYLLHDIYLTDITNEEKDALFSETAATAFDQIFNNIGKVNLGDLASTLSGGISEGHVLLWFADSDQEQMMEKLGCSGTPSQDQTSPVLGVYVDDSTISKLSWYLSVDTQVGPETVNTDGSRSYVCTTTYKNNLSSEDVAQLSTYILGSAPECRQTGDMVLYVYLTAPAGGSISNVSFNGYFPEPNGDLYSATITTAGMQESNYQGLNTWYGKTQILPADTTTITYTVTTSPRADNELIIRTTPTLQEIAGWE